MIHFGTEAERQMLRHVEEVMADRLREEDGYEDVDQQVVDRIGVMGAAAMTGCLVLTGAEMTDLQTDELMRRVVDTEVSNWVPDASQRLLSRASLALGYTAAPEFLLPGLADCGAEPDRHALVRFWLIGKTYMRCVSCGHLYRD